MATSRSQRIGIWIIVIVFSIGAVATFVGLVIATQNDTATQQRITKLSNEYQAKVAAQTKELSDKYYPILSPYQDQVASFDVKSVTSVTVNDLVVGDGETITENSSYSAYYIGWNPEGKIFDSSISAGALKAPLSVYPGGVIEGWTQGVQGMKTNGIRKISIPADKAYGSTGSGDLIKPNSPIKFVVMIVPTPAQVEIPRELMEYYTKGQ